MRDIQITMGAVETLNERIGILQDELSSLEKQKAALQTQIITAKTKKMGMKVLRIALFIVGGFCGLVSIFGFFSGDEDVMVAAMVWLGIAAAFIWGGVFCDKGINASDLEQKVTQINDSIEKKRKELDEYKRKKKEMILENERKLSDKLDEKMTEQFSFNDMDDTKECPMCAETVKVRAKICRYCGYEFE